LTFAGRAGAARAVLRAPGIARTYGTSLIARHGQAACWSRSRSSAAAVHLSLAAAPIRGANINCGWAGPRARSTPVGHWTSPFDVQ
jgi:hypothetical protein